jgi:formyl-CoA transferase
MPGGADGDTPAFNAVNRGKRSVVLDLKQAGGREAMIRLARSADILVENSRPGVMTSLGLGYATLAAVSPKLIYASISGYGQTGPYRRKGGLDLIAQGVSGIMSVTGVAGGPPCKAGVPLTDLGAALFALVGILAAVQYRHRTGQGQHVDTSLLDAGVALSVWEATEYFAGSGVPTALGSAHRMVAPYQAVRCADGHVTVGASNDRMFRRLCSALGHVEWADDPAFLTNASRVTNRGMLATRIEAVTSQRPCAHWLAAFDANDVPSGPINDYAQVLSDAQVVDRRMVIDVEHPTLGPIRALGSPIKLSATPADVGRCAPRLGEHTEEVLKNAGFSHDEILRLRGA